MFGLDSDSGSSLPYLHTAGSISIILQESTASTVDLPGDGSTAFTSKPGGSEPFCALVSPFRDIERQRH